jgi:hypothetical protein
MAFQLKQRTGECGGEVRNHGGAAGEREDEV